MRKIYGNDNTNLTLTDKAQKFYSGCDPLRIIEKTVEVEDEEKGYVDEYRYDVFGIFSGEDMTAEEVNEMLEELADIEDGNPCYTTKAQELLNCCKFDSAVALMDDEIREAVHADLAPCSDLEFLAEYMKRHAEKYGEEFCV